MSKDLNLSSADYTWLLTIFYIAYIIFEWFALMWKVMSVSLPPTHHDKTKTTPS